MIGNKDNRCIFDQGDEGILSAPNTFGSFKGGPISSILNRQPNQREKRDYMESKGKAKKFLK